MSLPFDHDLPHGDLPHGDLPHGDLPHGDLPRGDLPRGDLPRGDLPLDDLPRRVLLLLLLLARDAALAVEQVDSPRARMLMRRGLTGGARVSLPCSPRRRASVGARPWMCQARSAV